MKALQCPNCGGKQFEELTDKRRCVYCGAEFEWVVPVSVVTATYSGDLSLDANTTIHVYNRALTATEIHQLYVDSWGLYSPFDGLKTAVGSAFLPVIKGCMALLGGML